MHLPAPPSHGRAAAHSPTLPRDSQPEVPRPQQHLPAAFLRQCRPSSSAAAAPAGSSAAAAPAGSRQHPQRRLHSRRPGSLKLQHCARWAPPLHEVRRRSPACQSVLHAVRCLAAPAETLPCLLCVRRADDLTLLCRCAGSADEEPLAVCEQEGLKDVLLEEQEARLLEGSQKARPAAWKPALRV